MWLRAPASRGLGAAELAFITLGFAWLTQQREDILVLFVIFCFLVIVSFALMFIRELLERRGPPRVRRKPRPPEVRPKRPK